jgi:hypothetical protein
VFFVGPNDTGPPGSLTFMRFPFPWIFYLFK